METSHWIKLGTIVAIIATSLYILAPSFVEWAEGPQAGLVESTSEVEAPEARRKVDLSLVLEVPEEQAEAVESIVRARLESTGTPLEKVVAEEEGVRVELRAGARPAEVQELVTRPGRLRAYPWSALLGAEQLASEPTEQPASTSRLLPDSQLPALAEAEVDPGRFDAAVRGLAGQPVPPDAQPVELGLGAVSPGSIAVGAPLDPELGPVLLGLDGTVVGLGWPSADGRLGFAQLIEEDPRIDALLASGPLPTEVVVAEEEQQLPDAGAGSDAPVERRDLLPAWADGMLADTALNLGLDLQGGVDLTLYVGLEEAVLGRVNRDVAQLREAAEEDGIAIASARRERVDPVILLASDVDLSELQSWFARRMPEYVYRDSPTGPTGELLHAFEMTDEAIEAIEEQAIEQVLETLRERVDETGVREPSIVKAGGGRINVQLPGKVDLKAALKAIGTTALLEFLLVDEEFDEAELQRMIRAAEEALPEDQFLDDQLLNDWLHDTGRLPPDRTILWQYEDAEGAEIRRSLPYPLKAEIVLTGNDVNNAGVAWDSNQRPYVSLEFKPQGSTAFCNITSANVGKRFAIVLDGRVRSAPNIRERICGGRASIEMGAAMDPMAEANTLALVLRTGSLTAPVIAGEVRTVGPTLGADAIRSGAAGMAVGSVFVLLFMAVWYGRAGVVADCSLVVNVLMVFAVLSMFGATLTLPGIAGIALTVGMAVDANIIIYERIREEMSLGQNARKAVEAGFEKGVVAVVDANITTGIAGVVLYSYGTGPIKGFAVTLLIGIGTTLVTALFISRSLLEFITRSSTARFRI